MPARPLRSRFARLVGQGALVGLLLVAPAAAGRPADPPASAAQALVPGQLIVGFEEFTGWAGGFAVWLTNGNNFHVSVKI